MGLDYAGRCFGRARGRLVPSPYGDLLWPGAASTVLLVPPLVRSMLSLGGCGLGWMPRWLGSWSTFTLGPGGVVAPSHRTSTANYNQ